MFKYIFCLIAILMQPIFAFLVFHKQEKQKAALKMPLVYLSGVYLVIQIFVFFKVCLKIPKDYQVYSYLLQSAILAVFIIIRLLWQQVINILQRFRHRNRVPSKCLKDLFSSLKFAECRLQMRSTAKKLTKCWKRCDTVIRSVHRQWQQKMRQSDS